MTMESRGDRKKVHRPAAKNYQEKSVEERQTEKGKDKENLPRKRGKWPNHSPHQSESDETYPLHWPIAWRQRFQRKKGKNLEV